MRHYKILLVALLHHLALATCSTLYLELLSTQFVQSEVVYTFDGDYRLEHSVRCPNDTLSLDTDTGELHVLRTIDFASGTLVPECIKTPSGHTTTIKSFYCFVVLESVHSILTVINVVPELLTTQLVFQQAFYTGDVVEGTLNASVVLGGLLRATTLPVEGLEQPDYRIIGEATDSFTVVLIRTHCEAFPHVLTTRPLRRLDQEYHEITLEAFTADTSTRTTIGVQVLDVNDGYPQFIGPDTSANLGEDSSPGLLIATFQSSDSDSGLNGDVRFSLSAPSPHFTLHPWTGTLQLFSPIDYETSTNINVSIVISDLGHPSLGNSTELTIFIDDINENPPDIHVLGVSPISVSEETGVGGVVATVEVSDSDSSGVSLTITNYNCDCFQISNEVTTDSGQHQFDITVAAPLDFETFPQGYLITLTAVDTDTPQLSSSKELEITIIDVNEPPSFPQSQYEATVLEGVPNGTEVIRLIAMDPDMGTNAQIIYDITTSNTFGSWFTIDAATGSIYTTAEIDYEMATSVQFVVTAQDTGSEAASTSLTITILDRNEHAPSFTSSEYSVTISESHSVTESIFDFSASDDDGSECNGAVAYTIVHSEPEDVFRVDSMTGLLYPLNNSVLDFEAFQTARVTARATDLGEGSSFFADITLLIQLTGVNDAHPVMDPISCPCWLTENTPNQHCQALTAHDDDSNNLEFLITLGNELERFIIDPTSGSVSPVTPLDREQQSTYTIMVAASDGQLESEPQPLIITVVDKNDSPPTYSGHIAIEAPQDLNIGEFIGSVAAEHLDAGFHGLTMYSFGTGTPQSVRDRYKLDPLSGQIYAKQTLVPTTQAFTVHAADLLQPSQSASTSAAITISGFKNVPPMFETSMDRLLVPENLPVGDTMTTFTAADTGSLTYSLVTPSQLFTLEPSGTLTLTQSLSNSNTAVHTLNVSVSDSALLVGYLEVMLVIYPHTTIVADIELSHNAGVGVCDLKGAVAEESSGEVTVTSLPATQSGNDITYTIIGEEFSAAFRLDGYDVITEVGFGSVFDRTLRDAVFLTLRAQYGDNFHLCSLTVAINDINNHAPQFDQTSYSVEIYDNTPSGSSIFQFEALDLDVGSNAQTTYSLLTSTSAYSLGSTSGILESSAAAPTGTTLTVQAIDAQDSTKTDTATLTITVLQTSNTQPATSAPPQDPISVTETTLSGTLVHTIAVVDTDPGSHGENNLCIQSGNEYSLFTVNSNGQVMIHNTLDFEQYPASYDLVFAVFDTSPNPQYQTTSISFTITDVNDEPPQFTAPAYTGTIIEGSLAGTSVLTVRATDRDAGANGDIRYSLQGNPKFEIDSQSGVITTGEVLNREQMSSHIVTVTATDQATSAPRLSAFVAVMVTVLDVNDNRPVWTTPNFQTITFPESTPVGGELLGIRLVATDLDNGPNGQVRYSIASGNNGHIFSLDPWTGAITLAAALDYEVDERSYTIIFDVSDLGTPPMSAAMLLSVTFDLCDANDNYPVFSQVIYNCAVSESATFFDPPCQVSATDDDLTAIRYEVQSGTFLIDEASGAISIQGALDRETTAGYILQVMAEDSGSPSLTSTALVTITVLDTNDHVPSFDPVSAIHLPPGIRTNLSTITVPERLPTNTLLFHSHAVDSDEGENGEVSYSIIMGNSTLFDIDPRTGAVFSRGALNYESTQSYDLTILAANPSGTSITHVYTIQVMDIDESTLPPVFPPDTPLVLSVLRTSQPGSHITTIMAIDPDPDSDSLVYYITAGSGYGYFQIDSLSGNISTSFLLTGLLDDRLILEITAFNTGPFPSSTKHELLVILEPDSDSKPFFDSPQFQASVPEGFDQVGTVFTHVLALVNGRTDPSILYSIVGGNDGNVFAINASTGAVSVNSVLDREQQSCYNLTVQASKPGISGISVTLLVVNVDDVNDNRPQFTRDFNMNIFENYVTSKTLVTVFAVDGDTGSNAELEYAIVDPQGLPFNITPSTGDIMLTELLDATANPSYTFSITVTDRGDPPLISQVPLSITITVVTQSMPNNIGPVFPVPSDNIDINEDTAVGSLTYQVQAEDADGQTLMYRIVPPVPGFIVLPNNGEIYLTQPLDQESPTNSLRLEIEAFDGTRVGTFFLFLVVTDSNDRRPSFTMEEFSFSVIEHSSMDDNVGSVLAFDDDDASTVNAEVTYFIVDSEHPSSTHLFQLTPSGLLQVAGDIDRETLPTHILTVAVTDGGDPPLLSYGRTTVTVVDTNDHIPTFPFPLSQISIPEDTPVNSPIYIISAFDPDEDHLISYTLEPSNLPFEVNSSSGELMVTSALDAETTPIYSLIITAADPAQMSVPLQLQVAVLDVLDSPPILRDPGTVSVIENIPPYAIVTTVAMAMNARPVYYDIVGGNDCGHFFIETITGIVRTATLLDREAVSSYTMTVQGAFAPGFETNITFTVSVQDTNDNPPVFFSPILSYTLPENATIQTSLATLEITDPDGDSLDAFFIPDPLSSKFFAIDSSGTLMLEKSLDREGEFPSIAFDVYALDSGTPQMLSRARIVVTVADSNDHTPEFSEAEYHFTLSIPALVNTPLLRVSASDSDEGDFARVRYSITGGNGSANFALNAISGGISVTDNYRLQPLYTLVVRATDGGERASEVNIYIRVKECSFNNLVFETRTVTIEIPESEEPGSVILEPTVLDFGQSATLEFSLSVLDSSFTVNSATGSVSIGESMLDHEARTVHQFVLQATDTSTPNRIAQADIEVIVTDTNDNSPGFLDTPYTAFIANDVGIGHEVLTVTAIDLDEGTNALITYQFTSDPSNSFAIEPESGLITVATSLEGMQLGSTLTLTVQARDSGQPSLSSLADISIGIVDPNAPQFSMNVYTANISESAEARTRVIIIAAMGASGTAAITYRIEESTSVPFSVGSTSGEITVNDRGLNYESRQFYQITVIATDATTSLTGQARLDISIIDENDIPPVFTMVVYEGTVEENVASGHSVLQVSASDGDSEPNAQVAYELAENDFPETFFIDETSGMITTIGAIDYELNPVYEFTILAVDSGTPPLTGMAVARISTLNLNDNSPVFTEATYQRTVSEDASPGTSILFITAVDDDGDSLTYTIVEGSGNFEVNSEGLIFLNRTSVDLVEFQYLLNVSAFDGIFHSFSLVMIEIEDGNDHAPMFNQSTYTASIVENSPAGVTILQVAATDEDRGANAEISYSGSLGSVFTIHPETGVLTTAGGDIDRETTPTLSLIVIARDGGGRTGTADIQITVLDVNDNPPVFKLQSYITNVVETSDSDIAVISVAAEDPDSGPNGTVVYYIDIPDAQFPFVINPNTGEISNVFDLDHETTPLYQFFVRANDSGMPPVISEPVMVTIHVLNIADTPPVFTQNVYNVSVPELTLTDIVTVNASTTADCFLLTYSIAEEEFPDVFSINILDGVISVERTLDRTERDFYSFLVEANCLLAMGSITSYAGVQVHVLDVNEAPQFTNLIFRGMIPENSPDTTAVTPNNDMISIQVEDDDLGNNGATFFRLVDRDRNPLSNGHPFYIHPELGVLHTSGGLDRENISLYTFFVEAFDLGSPPMTSEQIVVVIITISDVNDSPPQFNQSEYNLRISEDTSTDTTIFTAAAFVSDADTPPNAQITYAISSGPFSIGNETGAITTTATLDHETTTQYRLEVVAFDGGLSTGALLIVNVTDINDVPPMFNASGYSVTVQENYATGQIFVQVFATDLDEGENAVVQYSILDNDGHLDINNASGEITFVVSPDFEDAQRLEFQIRAMDIGGLEDFVPLVILLEDENDNSPLFSEEVYPVEVRENLPSGTTIDVRVDASDSDSGSNGEFSYALTGPAAELFRINPSGTILTQVSFDREMNSSFELVVIATDGGTPNRSSSAIVAVTIADINDQQPQFPQDSYSISISEFEQSGHVILTVKAEDGDTGSNADVIYSLSGMNNQDFSLHENSNESVSISLSRRLNHEAVASYNLNLSASDGGTPVLTGTTVLLITVIDENDNHPIFSEPEYRKDVLESASIGEIILTVEAFDLDATDNSRLVYTLEDGHPSEIGINSTTGDVVVSQPLDFETQTTYTLTVIASDQRDSPLTGTATVTINIVDVNDNPPQFTTQNQTIPIVENNDSPLELAHFMVTDEDGITLINQITFSVQSGNVDDAFEIEADSGRLSVRRGLDRESVPEYLLVVTANDNGDPPLTGTAYITILVEDANDNDPVTGHQSVYIYLYEGRLPSTILGKVFVEDPDIINSHSFAIIDSPEIFEISQDGTITITDTPLPTNYSLQVEVKDGDSLPAVSTVDVQVGDVTMETIASSFKMQLTEVEADTFVVEKLEAFISTVEELVSDQASVDDIELQVFSIQLSPDDQGHLDLIMAVQTSSGTYIHPNLVQHVIHVNRDQVEESAGISIVTEHVDPCTSEPCSAGEECFIVTTFDLRSDVLGSASSATHLGLSEEYSISCQKLESPCASLVCSEPSYCIEEGGVATCWEDCNPRPCKNNGTCVPQNPGYYCVCPNGFDGRNCELTGATFNGSTSSVLFPALEQRSVGSISLELITNERNSLVFYSGRFDGKVLDFIALELIDGRASLRIFHGGGRGTDFSVATVDDQQLSDETWHTVMVQYNSSVSSYK